MKNVFVGLLPLCYIFFYCKDSSLEESAVESCFSIDTQHYPIAKAGLVDLGIDFKKEFYNGFMNLLFFVTEGIDFSEHESGELLLNKAVLEQLVPILKLENSGIKLYILSLPMHEG